MNRHVPQDGEIKSCWLGEDLIDEAGANESCLCRQKQHDVETTLDELDEGTAVLEAMSDEEARLRRQVEVLQQMSERGAGAEDAVRSMEVELNILRPLVDAELQRLQTRAASSAAAHLARGRHDANFLVEASRVQAESTEQTLREMCAGVRQTLKDLDSPARSDRLRSDLERRQRASASVQQRTRLQQNRNHELWDDLHRMEVANSVLERRLCLARKERSQRALQARKGISEQELQEEESLQRCNLEERAAARRAISTNHLDEVKTWRESLVSKKSAASNRAAEVREHRLQLDGLLARQRFPDQTAVEEMEAQSRREFDDWQTGTEEQASLVNEELRLLAQMRSKLEAKIRGTNAKLQASQKIEEGIGNGELAATKKLRLQERDMQQRIEAALADISQVRSIHADCEEASKAASHSHAELLSKVEVAVERDGCVGWSTSTAASQKASSTDSTGIGFSTLSSTCQALAVQHDVLRNLDFVDDALETEEASELRHLCNLEAQLEKDHASLQRRCERYLAGTTEENTALECKIGELHQGSEAKTSFRQEQSDKLRTQLWTLKEESEAMQDSLDADSAESSRCSSRLRELRDEMHASEALHRGLEARSTAAQARSMKTLQFYSDALSDLERNKAHCEQLKVERRKKEAVLQTQDLSQQWATRELMTAKRELLQLHDELSYESTTVWALQREVADLKTSASELLSAQREGDRLHAQMAALSAAGAAASTPVRVEQALIASRISSVSLRQRLNHSPSGSPELLSSDPLVEEWVKPWLPTRHSPGFSAASELLS